MANTENAQRPANANEMLRKKRNKGLGVGRQGSDEIRRRRMYDENRPQKTQDLWFHKDFAEQRREAISEYSMAVIQD